MNLIEMKKMRQIIDEWALLVEIMIWKIYDNKRF
jgi:hypothetical protein